MLPAALGRNIRLLEEALGTRLFHRTTRNVSLSQDGAAILHDAAALIARADDLAKRFRQAGRSRAQTLRVGAIDTAAAGLIPMLLQDFRADNPAIAVRLREDKTIRLLPKLMSGAIDLAFVRPPERRDKRIMFYDLFHESAVVAVPAAHPLGRRKTLSIRSLVGQPLIVPDRRSRPHSHDLTVKLFGAAGLPPTIGQVAEEKQTIVNLVAAEIGLAIIPRWASRFAVPGVRYIKLTGPREQSILPLAAAWVRGSRDPARDALLATLRRHLTRYAAES
jgi:DNA-binding transcriptional LysR family regulator